MRTIKAWNLIPGRIRRRIFKEMQKRIRTAYPSIYKLLLFGRTNINTPQYWDETWRTDTERRDYTELIELILAKVPEGSNVLDVGCGSGKLAKLIRDRRSAKVTCLDFSPWACQQLAAQGFDTIVSELPMIPLPDNSFDVVIATEVLEHLDRPDATLRQMRRVVLTGGLIMFSVPNNTLHPYEELEHQPFTRKVVENMVSGLFSNFEIETRRFFQESTRQFLFVCAVT